jgi:hypothetical protein
MLLRNVLNVLQVPGMLLAVGVSCETLFFGSLLLYSTDRLLDYGYEH